MTGTERRGLSAAGIVACSLVLATGGAAAESTREQLRPITAKLNDGSPLVFATFGDSITWPCFHTDFRQNYVTFTADALRKAYPRARVRIVHGGNMGTAARGLADSRFERHVLSFKPDVVFLMFGMNDCGAGRPGLEAYDAALTKLIRNARAAGALPVVATQNEIVYERSQGRNALPLYMARALEVARRENVPAADCFARWKPLAASREELLQRLNDDIHPNHAGHRLMARAILEALWPEAAQFVRTDVRTPAEGADGDKDVVECLLPGPPGKQVLRTADGTWFALTGRRRGGRLTDLVFSFSRQDRPRWQDFEHVTLTGRCADAVFDHGDRTLTGGLLLERAGRVYVVFGWNVGVFFVRLDVTRPDWVRRARDPVGWLDLANHLNVRPTSVASMYREGTVLHDAYLPGDGWPAVLCSDLKPAPGAGFEVVEGEEAILHVHRRPGAAESTCESPFPSFRAARCLQPPDGKVRYAAQKTAGGPLRLGTFDPPAGFQTRCGVDYFLLPAVAASPFGVARLAGPDPKAAPEDSRWVRIHWDAGKGETLTVLNSPPAQRRAVPLPWSDTKRDGVCWFVVETDPAAGPAFAYQAKLTVGAEELGVLADREGVLRFSLCPLAP